MASGKSSKDLDRLIEFLITMEGRKRIVTIMSEAPVKLFLEYPRQILSTS